MDLVFFLGQVVNNTTFQAQVRCLTCRPYEQPQYARCHQGIVLYRPCWCSLYIHKSPGTAAAIVTTPAFHTLKTQGIHLQQSLTVVNTLSQCISGATTFVLVTCDLQCKLLPAVRFRAWPAMQARHRSNILKCAVTSIRISKPVHSRGAQISAAFVQLYSSSGIMLPMLTWAPLTSHQGLAGRSHGYVISVQMATCTAGRRLSTAGPEALVVLSAAAAKCASTTV